MTVKKKLYSCSLLLLCGSCVSGCWLEHAASPMPRVKEPCEQIEALGWEDKSDLGMSGKELAAIAQGEFVTKSLAWAKNAKGEPAFIDMPHRFDPKGTVTMKVSPQPGKVQFRYGKECIESLVIDAMVELKSSEGVLDEKFRVRVRSEEAGRFELEYRFSGFDEFSGTLAQAKPSISELKVEEIVFGAYVNKDKNTFAGGLDVTLEAGPGAGEVDGVETEILVFPKEYLEEAEDEDE